MTSYLNPTTRSGGTEHIVVAERGATVEVEEAPYDDTQYVRINGGWVAVDVPPPVPDTLAPSPPHGLSASGTIAAGGDAVDYELSWAAPTTNVDSSPLTDLAYYVVRWHYGTGGPWSSFVSNDTSTIIHGLALATDVEWEVLARDTSGNDSTWASDTITGLTDNVGPEKPSIPILTTRLGTITARWDGLDYLGDPPPVDFDRLEFYVSATSGGPWVFVDSVTGAGAVYVVNAPVGDMRYVTAIAFDTSGNYSVRSDEASIEVQGVTGPDIEANSVTTNHLEAGSVTTVILDAEAVTADKLDVDALNGKTITGSLVQTDAAASTGVKLTTSGLFGWNGSAVNTFALDAGTGVLTALGATIAGLFKTADSGARVEISSVAARGGIHAIDFIPSTLHSSMDPASIESIAAGGFGAQTSQVKMRGGRKTDGSGFEAQVVAGPSGAAIRGFNTTTGADTFFEADYNGDARIVAGGTNPLIVDNLVGIDAAAMRTVFLDGDGSTVTTTSTTHTSMGTSAASGTFVAPASGIVEVTVASQLKSSVAGQSCIVGFEIRTGATVGSGTGVQAFDDAKAVTSANTESIRTERTYQISGLVPGDTYNIRTRYRSTSGSSTASAAWNSLIIRPSF